MYGIKFGFIARSRRVACTMADDAPAFVDLHAAARAGDLVALGARVAAGDEVDGRDKHKRTALHMAAWAGQVGLQIRAPPLSPLRRATPLPRFPIPR